jgi:hypothetical protein
MKKYTLPALLAAVLTISAAGPGFAGAGWQANLLVDSGKATSKLTFGQHPAATDGNDGFYDVPALFSGQLQASFTNGGETLWRDIRAANPAGTKKWRVSIVSESAEEIALSWDRDRLPPNSEIVLIDLESQEFIDMKTTSGYVLENRNGGELIIKVSDI